MYRAADTAAASAETLDAFGAADAKRAPGSPPILPGAPDPRPDSCAYGRASRIMLNGVSAARLTLWNPPAVITSRRRASPACAPSAARTSCDSEVGTHPIVEPA